RAAGDHGRSAAVGDVRGAEQPGGRAGGHDPRGGAVQRQSHDCAPGIQRPPGRVTALADLLARIERGERLPTDPWLSVVPPAGNPAVLSFPGRIVVAADLDPAWVFDQVPDGDLSAPMNPPFLHACERKLGRRVNSIDMLLLAPRAPGPPA